MCSQHLVFHVCIHLAARVTLTFLCACGQAHAAASFAAAGLSTRATLTAEERRKLAESTRMMEQMNKEVRGQLQRRALTEP